MDRLPALFAVSVAAVLCACSNVVTIYDYSGRSSTDTVYVEKPVTGPAEGTPGSTLPGSSVSPPPPGASSVAPPGEAGLPGESGPGGSEIEHPGRWSTIQPLQPGTARVQTICSSIDSTTTYRMIGNVLDGRGSGPGGLEIDAETCRSYDGTERYCLIVIFESTSPWQEIPAEGDFLEIQAGGNNSFDYGAGAIDEVSVEPLATMSYRVTARLPISLREMRQIQSSGSASATLFDGAERVHGIFSQDNLLNFRTFFEIFMVGDGTKTMVPEEAAPGGRVTGPAPD